MKKIVIFCMIFVIGFILINIFQNKISHRTEKVLGTECTVLFFENSSQSKKVMKEIFNFLQTFHNIANIYDENSELSRLNRDAGKKPFKCSDLLWEVLEKSRYAYKISDGKFDISAGALMKLWGFHKKRETLPKDAEVSEFLKNVGLNKVIFNDAEKSVFFTCPEMSLDFGGIAKGFALDKCVKISKDTVNCGVINLGGNIYCFSEKPPDTKNYRIGIKAPSGYGIANVVEGKDFFVATSGDYENFRTIENKKIAHIINPLTGRPVENRASVSVICESGVDSDILSTAVFIGGKEFAEKLVNGDFKTLQYLIVNHAENGGFNFEKFGESWSK